MSVRFIGLVGATLFAIAAVAAGDVHAQSQTPPPDKIDQLIQLLSDPDVKAWLAAQDAKEATPPPADAAGGGESAMAPAGVSSALDVVRKHIHEMAEAVPTLPAQFDRAWTRSEERRV